MPIRPAPRKPVSIPPKNPPPKNPGRPKNPPPDGARLGRVGCAIERSSGAAEFGAVGVADGDEYERAPREPKEKPRPMRASALSMTAKLRTDAIASSASS